MSALSFREQAAIKIRTTAILDRALDGDEGTTSFVVYCADPYDSAEEAQKLADACCAAWGHDIPDLDCAGMSEREAERAISRNACRRCGAKP